MKQIFSDKSVRILGAGNTESANISCRYDNGRFKSSIIFKKNLENSLELARIELEGESLYSFVGGMFYSSNKKFTLNRKLNLGFPYTTYYKFRIPALFRENKAYKNLIYSKAPILVVQLEGKYLCINFAPVLTTSLGKEIVPFVSFEGAGKKVIIDFAIFNKFPIKRKKEIWLGIGKDDIIDFGFMKGESLSFELDIKCINGFWFEEVENFCMKNIEKNEINESSVLSVMNNLKTALWRSWDDKCGTFGQLPWKDMPGFALDNYSFGLTTYEAVNMSYFYEAYLMRGDDDFLYWTNRLRGLFLSDTLWKTPRIGKGRILYEITNCNGNLSGNFYLSCGYVGYPGGQSTIVLHLLKYVEMKKANEKKTDRGICEKARLLLEYILSTQNTDGSWPMAIGQGEDFNLQLEKMEKYRTTGGTGECARALLAGYKFFGDKKYLEAARKALSYLEPIKEKGFACFGMNSLRDIGKDEIEGISAIYIIHAFLDYYELFRNESCRKSAIIWANYLLTWYYFWKSSNLDMKYVCHPISQSITPRVSPYETLLAVNLLVRLYTITGKKIWRNMAEASFFKTLKFVENDGGMCECYFPDWIDGFSSIPMEQTFATAELLKASMEIAKLKNIKIEKMEKKMPYKEYNHSIPLKYEIKDNFLKVFYKKGEIFELDWKNFRVTKMFDILNAGIDASFGNVYSRKSMINATLKNKMKTGWKRVIMGAADSYSVLSGISSPKMAEKEPVRFSITKKSGSKIELLQKFPLKLKISAETEIHSIEYDIEIVFDGKILSARFDPFVIRVKMSGLCCDSVFYPDISMQASSIENNGSCAVIKNKKGILEYRGAWNNIIKAQDSVSFDISLLTNWTNHGVFRAAHEFIARTK